MSKDRKIIFVLGGPGSGKGTQCERMQKEYGFPHFSAGDLLRAEVKSGSERGKTIQTIMTNGELVPSEITVELLNKAMDANKDAPGFLIDGFPRNIEQAKMFEESIGLPTLVISFELDDDAMTKRILARAETSGRTDDNVESLKKRFVTHRELCVPVIERYDEMKLAHKIDASGTVDEIFAAVKRVIDA